MKILQAHSRYRSKAPSGENNVVDQEASLLIAAGHRVETFQRHSDDIPEWGLLAKAALPARSVWNSRAKQEVEDQIDDFGPDVVHVHNTFPLLSASVLYACRDRGVPVVATIHNYKLLCASGDFFRAGAPCHECGGGRILPAMAHGCYRESRLATAPVAAALGFHRSAWRSLVSAYIFLSASQRELMGGLGLPASRSFVKHNFVERGPHEQSGRREHIVVYVGRLDPAKGAPLLMRAWDAFRDEYPMSPLRLVIAGGGPLADEVQRWSSTHQDVEYVGLLPPGDVDRLLRRALATIIPSQWEETFGLVAIEAMAAGVTPIAPARGSFPELLTNDVDGSLFAPDDPEDVVRVLHDVDSRPAHHVKLGLNARGTYERRFLPGDNREILLDVYRFAIAHPVAGAGIG